MGLFSPAALSERVLEPLNASLPAPAPADHGALAASGCSTSSGPAMSDAGSDAEEGGQTVFPKAARANLRNTTQAGVGSADAVAGTVPALAKELFEEHGKVGSWEARRTFDEHLQRSI